MSGRILIVFLLVTTIALVGVILTPPAALQAASPPEPTYGSADVDGSVAEWNLETDFFANMYRAGKAGFPLESRLYLRYDCSANTLYALVLAEPGVSVLVNSPSDQFVKLGNSVKLVDGNSGDDGAVPDFAWVGVGFDGDAGHARGWEASARLTPATFTNLNVHAQVYDDGESQTSAVEDRAISLALTCPGGATLTLVKTVVNDDGGMLTNLDFPVYVDGVPATWATVSLAPGAHMVRETAHPGYAPSVWGGDCLPDGSVALSEGQNKTCTVTNDDHYFGGFVECVRPEADGYWIRFGYQWDGSTAINLARSDLTPAIDGVALPQVFQPGRHVLDDVFVPHLGNVVWNFAPTGFGVKTVTGSPAFSRLCYAYCGEPVGDDWQCDEGLIPYDGVCRNPDCPGDVDCVCPSAVATYELGNRVWYDTDRDGRQDSGEPGVRGVMVRLFGNGTCSGTAFAKRTTDAQGRYLFTNLPAGTYCLAFGNLPTGWSITLRDQAPDNIDSDANRVLAQIGNIHLRSNDYDQDAGLYVDGQIGDRVWCDADLDGRYDGGEGVGNVTIWLYADGNCDGSEGKLLATTTTIANGSYAFSKLAAGPLRATSEVCYVVKVNTEDPDLRTCDVVFTQRKYQVLLNASQPAVDGADFGFKARASQEEQFVPEPGSAVLLVGGLSGLASWVALRRRKW